MKKIAIRLAVVLVVLVLLGALAVHLFLDSAIKHGVETIGPALTKSSIKLDAVSLSLLSGSGKIKGLVVGNPEGFKSPSAIQVGSASLALRPGSVFSDKVIVQSIELQQPEITFETDLKGNNLSKLLANVQSATQGEKQEPAKPTSPAPAPEPAAKAGKKLQVNDFVISDAKLHVSVTAIGRSATVSVPKIHLTNLGTNSDGITSAELVEKVLKALEQEAVKAAGATVTDLSKNAAELTKDLGNTAGGVATGAVNKVTKGIGGLFKK